MAMRAFAKTGVVRHYVPRTLEIMYPWLETMHFDQKFDKKSEITRQCLKVKIKSLTFQHKNSVYDFHFQYPG